MSAIEASNIPQEPDKEAMEIPLVVRDMEEQGEMELLGQAELSMITMSRLISRIVLVAVVEIMELLIWGVREAGL